MFIFELSLSRLSASVIEKRNPRIYSSREALFDNFEMAITYKIVNEAKKFQDITPGS